MMQKTFSKTPVIIYYLIAVAISGPLFYWRSVLNWEGFDAPNIVKVSLYMWGPGIAGIICYLLYRNRFRKEITVLGTSKIKSICIWFVPLLVLAALGIKNKDGVVDHITPLSLCVIGFLTVWGEEFGWRWFLQDYLQSMKPIKKYLLIGVLWEIWHLRFLSRLGDPWHHVVLSALMVMVVTVTLAIIIGAVTDRTKSLAFAATLHAWVNMMFEFPVMTAYIVAALTFISIGILYFTWPRSTKVAVIDDNSVT